MSPSYLQSEEVVRHLVLWLRLAVETLKFAAIAGIRTGLNFLLTREMETEAHRVRRVEPSASAA